jgi:hypothetical protein
MGTPAVVLAALSLAWQARTRMHVRSLFLLLFLTGCPNSYARVYDVLAASPRPAVRVVPKPPILHVRRDSSSADRALPPGYDALANLFAETLAREWPNDAVEVGPPLRSPAVTAEVTVSGDFTDYEGGFLDVGVSIVLRRSPNGPWVGDRYYVVGFVRERGGLETALAKALDELRVEVPKRTAEWVRDLKKAGK